jgi:hypothetical protein
LTIKKELVTQLLSTAIEWGLTDITPSELSEGGNLIIHLAPYPIVARIATVLSEADEGFAYKILDRELRVARYLHSKDVPVLLPTSLVEAGPHNVAGAWLTLWTYVSPTALQPPSSSEAVNLINKLSMAMKDFEDEVPMLGVWERTCQSAQRLRQNPDERIQALLQMFQNLDEQMRVEPDLLRPSHGDAHAGNLIPSPEGWIWMDFEDVSLMPAYWDLASYVGNFVLFGGTQEPSFTYMLEHSELVSDQKAFGFAVSARILMSTLGNLDFALAGHGDLEFATKQLELAGPILQQIDLLINGLSKGNVFHEQRSILLHRPSGKDL